MKLMELSELIEIKSIADVKGLLLPVLYFRFRRRKSKTGVAGRVVSFDFHLRSPFTTSTGD